MKKKLICCLCALSIIAGMITCTPIFADGYDVTKAVETLKALDIIESADAAKVSKDYLVSALAGFLYDEPDALGTPEYIARLTGMLTAGEAYDGSDTATADFAVRCAVIALGYGIKAQEYGGNSAAYTRIASELDITDGVSVGADAVFTMKDLVRLLYQMLDAEPLVPNFGSGSELKYEVKKGETLLSQNRGIYKVEGIETATARTSLDGESGIGTDRVELDGEKYDTEVDACKLLGRNVRAYVRDENDTRTVIYIEEYEKRNDILTIEAEDIKSVSEDFSAVEYYKTEAAVKKAKIADAPSVIFNGKFYGRYTAEDLKPGIGRLELIDNDRDGRYDVINIISYETMVVDSVNTADKEITNYFAYDGSIAKLELEPDKGEVEYKIFDSEGKEIGIGAINRLDVLSVAKSKASDENYIEIYVASETCEGTIDYIDIDGDDTILSIDGIDYLESYHFKEYLKYESKELNIGDRIAAYLDFFGNVAYFKKLQEDYCIFATARYDGETDEYRITYMTLDEEWIVTPFAEKLKVNSEMMSAEAAYVILSGMKPQVVKLEDRTIELNYKMTKMFDTTRPCIDTSGHYHVITDIYDTHDYDQDVENFAKNVGQFEREGILHEGRFEGRQFYNGEPTFMSEYGGIKWNKKALDDGLTTSWGYGVAPESEEEFIARYKGLTDALLDAPDMIGFCYTQLYDVEQEMNGLYTYEREPKFDIEIFRKINTRKAKIEE